MATCANGPVLAAAFPINTPMRTVCRQRRYDHWSNELYYEGSWDVGHLQGDLTGRLSRPGEEVACSFAFDGTGLILQFWSHPWSGLAHIAIDGIGRTVDLYGESAQIKYVHFDGLKPGIHIVRASSSKRTDTTDRGDQIIFCAAFVYDRGAEPLQEPHAQQAKSQKPCRFNAIYHAPGSLTWQERTLLYALVFASQPQSCLILGVDQGGSALIVASALEDLGAGSLTCIASEPNINPSDWRNIGHRTNLIVGHGPDAIQLARNRTGTNFTLVFLEGREWQWDASVQWLIPALEPAAIVLLHDDAAASCVRRSDIIDCGLLATTITSTEKVNRGPNLRMLRYCPLTS